MEIKLRSKHILLDHPLQLFILEELVPQALLNPEKKRRLGRLRKAGRNACQFKAI